MKLIVEMEMKNRCIDCQVRLACKRYIEALQTMNGIEKMRAKIGSRDCLIKGVLPDEHGRLIDASTVIGIQQDEEDNDVPVTVDDYLGLQFPVPTIVPATERSKHGTTAD